MNHIPVHYVFIPFSIIMTKPIPTFKTLSYNTMLSTTNMDKNAAIA